MRLTEEVRKLLLQGAESALAERVATNRRLMRPLMARLWDLNAEVRERAARSLGRAAAMHPDMGLELVRRLMWALNDESTTNGVYGVPALGEIGRHAPGLLAPFLPALVTAAEDEGLRLEILRALRAVAETNAALVEPHLAAIERRLDRAEETLGNSCRRCPKERES